MRVTRIIAILIIGGLLILSACTKPSAMPTPMPTPEPIQGANEVWVSGREFKPSIKTVPVGTKVTWVNKEGEEHTVTSSTGLFDGLLAPGSSLSYTFTERGTFEYYCQVWPMSGAVVVQ